MSQNYSVLNKIALQSLYDLYRVVFSLGSKGSYVNKAFCCVYSDRTLNALTDDGRPKHGCPQRNVLYYYHKD